MAIFKLLKSGFRCFKATKEKINQLNKGFEEKIKSIENHMDRMHKTHNLKHAFEIEGRFRIISAIGK